MTKVSKNIIIAFGIFAISIAVFSSCKRIELHRPNAGVYVRINITHGPSDGLSEEIMNIPDPTIRTKIMGRDPDKIRVIFYDINTHEYVTDDFVGLEGGFIDVPSGYYDVIAYGMGTSITRLAGLTTRAGCYAYSSSVGSSLRMTKVGEENEYIDYPIYYEPDVLFVGRAENVFVPVRAEQDKTVLVDLQMPTLFDTYSFEVLNIEGAENIQNVEVYITGQAAYRYLWDKRMANKVVALNFSAPIDKDNGCIRTVFSTFGSHSPQAQNDVYMNIMVTDARGGRYQWIYNVTEQFNNPDNTDNKIVIDDRIVIPSGMDGGIMPDVNDWVADITYVPL